MKYHKSVYESFVMLMQFGLNMIVPIFILTLVGVYIGDKYDMDIIVIPLFLIGALAGFRNIYVMAKKIYTQETERDTKEKMKKNKEKEDSDVKQDK